MYYFALPFIYLVSILPMRAMYVASDILYLIVFGIIGYRRNVIRNNLRNSFPEKSESELKAIENSFKRYFCDLILETIKTLTIRKQTLEKRVAIDNPEVFRHFFEKRKSIVIVMGHLGNWELAGARFGIENLHKLIVIYHPLKDRNFNRLIVRMRTRLGNELYPRRDVLKGMLRDRDRVTATAFIADQTPSPEGAYWTKFLNQDTAVFTGTEKIARKFNYPVIYVSVFRVKRGYYRISGELLFDNPKETTGNQISEAHTRRLESDILRQPEIWLWSHNRWKHKRLN